MFIAKCLDFKFPVHFKHLISYFVSTSLEPASFVSKPDPQEVLPGSTVKFTCVVTGTAPLKVKWFRGNTELVTGRKCRISFSDSISILELLNVEPSQSEDYICRVRNEAGEDSCTTKLFVKGL